MPHLQISQLHLNNNKKYNLIDFFEFIALKQIGFILSVDPDPM